MNDSGLMDARLLELYRDGFEVLAVALVAGVVLVLLAQVAVTALCCWETMRSLRERKERPSAPGGRREPPVSSFYTERH